MSALDSTSAHAEWAYFNVSSNGLGAARTHEAALCHGLLELIERDAWFRWQSQSKQAIQRSSINVQSIDDANQHLLSGLLAQSLQINIWNATSALGVPTFHCALWDDSFGKNNRVHTGTGAHLSKQIALTQAITEAVQSRVALVSGSRDDIFPSYYLSRTKKVDRTVKRGTQLYQHIPDCIINDDILQQVDDIIRLLADNGYAEGYIIDHTKADIGIPVKQILIPMLAFHGVRM